jgi:O-antigen/teichoic acid export membrane protein
VVLLPEASRYIARRDVVQLRRRTFQVVLVAASLTIAIVIAFLLLGDWLLATYLGPSFGRIAHVARITMLGALPLVLFFVLRSIIDAYHVRPVNARNLLVAFGVLVLLMGAGLLLNRNSEESGAFFQVIAFAVLAILTMVEVQTILSKLQPAPGSSMPV